MSVDFSASLCPWLPVGNTTRGGDVALDRTKFVAPEARATRSPRPSAAATFLAPPAPPKVAFGARHVPRTETIKLHAPAVVPAAIGRPSGVFIAAKRIVDVVGAAVLLALASPLLLLIAAAVFLDSGRPILYRGQRLGRHGEPFEIIKFRTMGHGSTGRLFELLEMDEQFRMEYEATHKLRRDPRCTRIGHVLRRASMDELPQLVNVLVGTMSLIGPRPYSAFELAGRSEADGILSVRPGITGLWQVNGRSDCDFEKRLDLDVEYVRTRGWRGDLAIAARTVRAVLSGRGAY